MANSKIRTSTQVTVDADFNANSHKITSLATPTVSTDAANKAYVDAVLGVNDAFLYKGVIDASADPNYPAADAGHVYKISVAGHIGGASGVVVEVGDIIICCVDGSSAGTQAAVGANWDVIEATNPSLPTIVTREVPSGTKNGINPTFVLANTPTAGTEHVYLNGQLLNQGAGNDYTISGGTITMLTSMIPVSTDVLLCSYQY